MTNHYNYVFEHLPTPVWIKSMADELLYINQSFAKLFHLNPYQIIGHSLDTLIASAGIPYLSQLYLSIKKNSQNAHTTLKTDLGLFKHTIFMYPDELTKENIVLGLLLRAHDELVSPQENLLQTIIDNVPEMIFYKNQEGSYQGANKSCIDFYGVQGVDNFLGKTDSELSLDKSFIDKCLKHDQLVIASKRSLIAEGSFIAPDGSKSIFETTKTPVFDKYGHPWGIVGITRDITAQKSLEDNLRYLSYTDILSGLYNRAYFNEAISKMIQEEVFPIGFILGDVNGLKIVNDTLGHLAGDKLIQATASQLKLACPKKSLIFRWGGDEFVILLPNATKEECEALLERINESFSAHTWYVQNQNEDFKLSISLGYSLFRNKSDSIDKVLQDAEEKVYHQKMLNGKSVRSSILLSLQNSLETRNLEVKEHIQRIIELCLLVGQALSLDASVLDELALVAQLHDIGKVGIPEAILLKPTELTYEELEILKTHSEKGYRLTNLFPELSHISRAILTHHEKWNGSGYPLGLKGKEIPLTARIIAVVDAYDTMMNNLSYGPLKSKEEALKELRLYSNSHFDPHIVEVFCELV